MTTQLSRPGTDEVRRRARRGLLVFGALVVLLSAPFEIVIARTHAMAEPGGGVILVAPLMMMPTLASVITRLVLREGFADVSFRLGPDAARLVRRSPLLPLLVGLVSYGAAVALGLAELAPPAPLMWVVVLVVALVMNLVLSTGEEIGWRGYMTTRLVDAGVPAPLWTGGLLWGLWHVPLVLWGGLVVDGPTPWVSALLLVTLATAFGYLLGRSRVETGSVWPAVALHVVWNAFVQQGFDLAVTGAHHTLWVGEAGVLTVATMFVLAVLVARRPLTRAAA